MFFAFVMSIFYLNSNDVKYKNATFKSAEATYEGSEVKGYVVTAGDRLREQQPLLSKIAPIGYSVFYKKNISFKNDKWAITGDVKTGNGQVSYTWHW